MARPSFSPSLSTALDRLSILDLVLDPLLSTGDSNVHHPLLTSPGCSMEGVKEAIATLSRTTAEVKTYLRRNYEVVCTSVKQNEELATEVRYNTTQLSCQDSRIDDLERNLFEIMGKLNILKDEIYVLTSKSQHSQVQEAPTVNQEMMDAASVQQQNYG